MGYLVTYLPVLLAVVNGVKWNDFRVLEGDIELPITLSDAESKGWVLCENDDTHNLKWLSKDNDWAFSLAFDQKTGVCSGVHVIIYESLIDSKYLNLYKDPEGIFEKIEFHGAKAYKSSVIFSPKGYVTKQGQARKDPDEVAYFAFLKEGASPRMISRHVCDQAEASFTEQGCRSNYGLILSDFGSKTKCKNLKPFYTIYDPNGSGDLIGFGWISFHTVTKPDSIIKPLAVEKAKSMFPQSPSCLTSSSKLAVVEVWLSFSAHRRSSCSSNSWVETNCKKKARSKAVDSSEESFWHKLFG